MDEGEAPELLGEQERRRGKRGAEIEADLVEAQLEAEREAERDEAERDEAERDEAERDEADRARAGRILVIDASLDPSHTRWGRQER